MRNVPPLPVPPASAPTLARERGFVNGILPLAGVVALAVGAAGAVVALVPRASVGPVADIDHSVHVARDIDCVVCHTGVLERAKAGTPSIQICKGCHEGEAPDKMGPSGATENTRRISAAIAKGEELWWPRLYSLPDHLVFSHRRHVGIAGLECAQCHGAIASAKTLPDEPVARTLVMDGCLDCHTKKGASTDCFACHR